MGAIKVSIPLIAGDGNGLLHRKVVAQTRHGPVGTFCACGPGELVTFDVPLRFQNRQTAATVVSVAL